MAHWQFRNLHPNENSGTNTIEDNFANEDRTNIEILVRESLQNPLDARQGEEPVRVTYQLARLADRQSLFAKALLTPEFETHLSAGKLSVGALPDSLNFLVIEDFGTVGLQGTYSDSSVDGSSENWNAFWFREGDGAKPTKSNGGAGQGKVTLYTTSQIRTVLALTKRATDGKTLLFGCCKFRQNYKLPHETVRWAKEALWGTQSSENGLALPIEDAAVIESVQTSLALERHSHSGTSFLVPLPRDVTLQAIETAVLNEFYFAIKRGKLEVVVGTTVINKLSVGTLARKLGGAGRHPNIFLDFLDAAIASPLEGTPTAAAGKLWANETKLAGDCFEVKQLEALRQRFEQGKISSVDFPVQVRLRSSVAANPGMFRVVLLPNGDSDASHELFVRRDLCIDGEKRLRGSRRVQPVLALTFINEDPLSGFLAAAEEPTHRTWNSKRPKLAAQYAVPEKVLNAVRNAALRLVELITPAGERDHTALSMYFADPAAPLTNKKGGKGTASKQPIAPNPDIPPIPTARKKAIKIHSLTDGFKIEVDTDVPAEKLPLYCDIEVAYATTLGDAFDQWDAAEFWLDDAKAFPTLATDIENLSRDGNRLNFNMASSKSQLVLTGFDPNRQLEVRVKYTEGSDAAINEDN